LRALRHLGCAEGQGGLLSPPLDAGQARALLAGGRGWAQLMEEDPT
jgi:hypothetical protein